jgi:hypothetical protein
MKRIPNLVWTPAWTSLVGCLHGCLKHLNKDPGFSWLFGGSGHALIINMSQDGSCPSGPTAWNTSRFFELGSNLGCQIEILFADKRQPEWEDKKKQGWDFVRSALDQDLPVVGWELAIPEFYVIDGYDATGYYYNGPGDNQGPQPKPWHELGETEIGMLEILSVSPGKAADDRTILRGALDFAVKFNEGSSDWVLPDYLAGQQAYEVWIEAVSSGKAMLMGHAYNAAVWEECRRNGVAFLQEAKKRLDDTKLDHSLNGAIRSYGEVTYQLKDLSELFPFFENNREEPVGKNPRSKKAAEHLIAAKLAEAEAHKYLKEILQGLN